MRRPSRTTAITTAASQAAAATPAVSATPHVAAGHVIVVLKDQPTRAVSGIATAKTSMGSARAAQDSVSHTIRSAGGDVTHSLSLINAVSADLSTAQAQKLAADPRVAEIIPDAKIYLPHAQDASTGPEAAAQGGGNYDSSAGVVPPANTCSGTKTAPQLEPEALETTHTDSDQPGAVTARSLGYDGSGVTVAYMAEGIDINNPDFMRNGKSVFTDYKDFSGDGIQAPTAAGEAFLDASAIAAQGNQTYDVSHFSKLPLSTPCYIKVEGEAPGVNMVGLKVFGDTYTTTIGFLQAINYAVKTDHVDVLNESFGGSPIPDTTEDVVRLANQAAIAAGTTVAVSTGDAGITNTIGSPASDPDVIAVGATTTYRFDLQTGYAAGRFPGITGWLDDNISSLSSGGFTTTGRTPDLTAPGELNWGLCTPDTDQYEDCLDYANNPSSLEASGGTSESAPIVAGIAALVIQAYAKAHGGTKPTPAVVKAILTGSADDIDAPAEQQGAGIVDAAKAVLLAQSYGNTTADPTATQTLPAITTSSPSFVSAGAPGEASTLTEDVTNHSNSAVSLAVSGRTLGAYTPISGATTTVDLEDPGTKDADGNDIGSPQYVDFQGYSDNYGTQTFTVPSGSDRLEASIAYQAATTALGARVRLTLIDPNGKLAAYSLPQGIGNYGHVEVAKPAAGTWTAVITSRQGAKGGTVGPVQFGASTAQYQAFGTVDQSTLTLAPGQTAPVKLSFTRGKVPGDVGASLVLRATTAVAGTDPVAGSPDTLADQATTTVPVTVRTLVPSNGMSFTQTLTGPNGRDNYPGVTFSYQIPIKAGTPGIGVGLYEGSNDANQAQVFLISPSGNLTALGSNIVPTNSPLGGADISLRKGLTLHTLKPTPGLWTVEVQYVPLVNGEDLSSPFEVGISTGAPKVSGVGVPNSAKVKHQKGKTFTAAVRVTNRTSVPETYFVDPRTDYQQSYDLTSVTDSAGEAPTAPGDNVPYYVVPSNTTTVQSAASSGSDAASTPIQYDLFSALGDPDIGSDLATTATTPDYTSDYVVPGLWGITAAQAGPYDTTVTPVPIDTAMRIKMQATDTTVDSTTGDLWQVAFDPNYQYNPVTVQPGKSATIAVDFTPRSAGDKSGVLYIGQTEQYVSAFGSLSALPYANQIGAVPFHYTVTKGAPKQARAHR